MDYKKLFKDVLEGTGKGIAIVFAGLGAATAMEILREQAKNYKEKGLEKEETVLLLKNKYGIEHTATINSAVNSVYSTLQPSSTVAVITIGAERGHYLRIVPKDSYQEVVIGPFASRSAARFVYYDNCKKWTACTYVGPEGALDHWTC
jgi:hypothetical protein